MGNEFSRISVLPSVIGAIIFSEPLSNGNLFRRKENLLILLHPMIKNSTVIPPYYEIFSTSYSDLNDCTGFA